MRRLVLLLFASACFPAPAEPHPALLEAVDWYTGVAGTVDEARAREGPLALMWLARAHSTGRMGYARAAAAGNAQAREALARMEG